MKYQVVCAFAVLTVAFQAQNIPQPAVAVSKGSIRLTMGGPMPFSRPAVTGGPYSAEESTEHNQTLADGTHISQKFGSRMLYRDSQGRTRTERAMMMRPGADDSGPKIIEIFDPVAGFQYTLDPVNKVAHRVKLQPRQPIRATPEGAGAGGRMGVISATSGVSSAGPPVSSSGSSSTETNATRPQFSNEKLGTQMIDGIMAEGHRTTTTIPTGAQGNDRPLVSTQEFWMASDLKIMILSKNNDPRNGESVTRLSNISRVEPNLALFEIPGDYKIVDEEGPFTIEIPRQ